MKKSFWSIIWVAAMLFSFCGTVNAGDLVISSVFDNKGVATDDAYTRILN